LKASPALPWYPDTCSLYLSLSDSTVMRSYSAHSHSPVDAIFTSTRKRQPETYIVIMMFVAQQCVPDFNIVYTRGDRRRNWSGRSSRRQSPRRSPVGCSIKRVYIVQNMHGAIVAARRLSQRRSPRRVYTLQATGRSDDCSDNRGDDRPICTAIQLLCITVCHCAFQVYSWRLRRLGRQ